MHAVLVQLTGVWCTQAWCSVTHLSRIVFQCIHGNNYSNNGFDLHGNLLRYDRDYYYIESSLKKD